MSYVLFRPQLARLVLGMLVTMASCFSGTGPTGVVSTEYISNPEPTQGAAVVPPLPAFPGAEGFGASSVGGRGGRVIEVTNLNDRGPGSLRAAIEAEGPRIVVFRTGGTIELQSSLEITNPYITIAGQTAPGGGIALKNHPSHKGYTITILTNDVIIRYIRVRPGPSREKSCCLRALTVLNEDAHDIIIDHSSFSWATDETVSTWYDPHDITIQWSIVSEALNCSTHEEGCHSGGVLLGSDGSRNISVHHNLFAHNDERNPMIKTSGVVDVVNNVIYNPGGTPSVIQDQYSLVPVNYVGNYAKDGPNSLSYKYFVRATDRGSYGFQIFVQANITPQRTNDDMSDRLVVHPDSRQWIVPDRHDAPLITTTSAFEAYNEVLADVGANVPTRDAVDRRIIDDVINGTGRIIDDPSEVGGWPELAAGTPPADSDHDGMPDNWEERYCLDPDDPSDSPGDADGDGYTNVEEYLNGTEPAADSICRLFKPRFCSQASLFPAPIGGLVLVR